MPALVLTACCLWLATVACVGYAGYRVVCELLTW